MILSTDTCKNGYIRKPMDQLLNKWTYSWVNETDRLNTGLCIQLVSQQVIQIVDKWRKG